MAEDAIPDKESTGIAGLRQTKKLETWRRILRSSERMFQERGYADSSMSEIAEDANVSRKTVFNYFESKDAIILALVDEFYRFHVPGWIEPDTPTYWDARDVVAPGAHQRLDILAESRWLLLLAASHTGFFSFGRTELVARTLSINTSARATRIAAVQAVGRLRTDIPAIQVSRYYEALRDLVITNWLTDDAATTSEFHASFDQATSMLVQGLSLG